MPASDTAPHEFTNVIIPLSDFTLTNSGDLSEIQIEMLRTRVRTVGISCLGPKVGRFELGIESIDCVTKTEAEVEGVKKTPEQLKEEAKIKSKPSPKIEDHMTYQMEGEMPEATKSKKR